MFLLRPFRFLAQALTAENTPKQLAWGFAMGMVVGLVPKGNLTAIVLMFVLGMTRINIAAGMVAAFVFSWIAMLTDPISHDLGLWLLSLDALKPAWTFLYNLPVVPWTDFNNTIVLGSLAMGLIMLYPAYRLSLPVFEKYKPVVEQKLRERKIVKWLFGAEWSARMGGPA